MGAGTERNSRWEVVFKLPEGEADEQKPMDDSSPVGSDL